MGDFCMTQTLCINAAATATDAANVTKRQRRAKVVNLLNRLWSGDQLMFKWRHFDLPL
jgi:hypothetical protein